MKRFIVYLIPFLMLKAACAADLAESFDTKKFLSPDMAQKIFTTTLEERQSKLEELTKERQQLLDSEKNFLTVLTSTIAEVTTQLNAAKHALIKKTDDSFLNKKLALLNERYQILKDLQHLREQQIIIIDQHVKLLSDYLKDHDFRRYKKEELKLGQSNVFTFEDLQAVSQMIQDAQKKIEHLLEQEKNTNIELENRKHTALANLEAYKKKKIIEQVATSDINPENFDLDANQRSQLAKQEELLFFDKKQRDEFLLKEIEHKKDFIKTDLFLTRSHLDIFKEAFKTIKPAIKVHEADIDLAKDDLEKKKQKSFELTESYRKEIETITQEQRLKEKKLEKMSSQKAIALGVDIDEWTREPIKTITGYLNFLEVAELNDQLLVLLRQKDLLETYMTFEDEKIRQESVHISVKNSFYTIIACKFISDEEIKLEKKKYDAPKAETKANLSLINERKNNAQALFDQQKKALENIAEKRRKIYEQRNGIFKGYSNEHAKVLELLNSAEEKIKVQLDILGKMLGLYSDITVILRKTTKQIEFIRAELESISIWYRPEHAISWEGIQLIVPTIFTFLNDVRSYITQIPFKNCFTSLYQALRYPLQLIYFLITLFILIFVFVMLKRVLPDGIRILSEPSASTIGNKTRLTLLMLAQFISRYFWIGSLWISLLILMQLYKIADPYPYILFYLASIPLLLYMAQRLIAHIIDFNSDQNGIFATDISLQRFISVFSILFYSTIAILFFNKAFLLASYHKSELPTILLAINFIIFQIALISLITKEQVLALIPTEYQFGDWLYQQVNKYYYLILFLLISIIVLSNPYIGFGKLVLYILSRLLYTALLLPLLWWLHSLIKQGAGFIFFYHEEGVIRERFDYGKTLYGVSLIVIFLSFIFLGMVFLAKVWSWPEKFAQVNQLSDIGDWLKTPIMLEKTDNPISVYSLLKIFSFIATGFIIAYAINRFILGRIFDVLLVDPGVQSTIASLTRYLILIGTVIMGFQSVGLGRLVSYLIVGLIAGIGWVIKDPIGDFVAYFIILVQRPVKIGDYITMDDQTMGVVRKITPRSVVIRKKNSTTLIVPNSTVIKKPIANWNYARGFIAFEDILVTVTYQSDPTVVKSLLEKVLEANPFVLKSPKPIVRLDSFGEYGFVFLVRGFLSSNYTLDQWEIASDVRLEIVKVLRQHAVQLAVPVHIVISKGAAQGFHVDEKEVFEHKSL